MTKVLAVISARASYARAKTVLKSLANSGAVDLKIALIASASSSRYGNLLEQIELDGFQVQVKLETQLDASLASSMAKTTALSLLSLADYIQNENITAVLIVADRHETLAGAIAGSYLGKKVFHLQGGEQTGNIDDKVRFANSFLSDYHFVATRVAERRLRDAGIDSRKIFFTGCPSIDIAANLNPNGIAIDKLRGVGADIERILHDDFIVVLQHSETTSDLSPKQQITPTIDSIEYLGLPTIWIWPNTDHGSEEIVKEIRRCREQGRLQHVHFEKSIAAMDFLVILSQASCVIGNSSVAIRECSFLGTPSVNIGGRQQGREFGINVTHVGFERQSIIEAINRQIQNGKYPADLLYGDGQAGERISDTIIRLLENDS